MTTQQQTPIMGGRARRDSHRRERPAADIISRSASPCVVAGFAASPLSQGRGFDADTEKAGDPSPASCVCVSR